MRWPVSCCAVSFALACASETRVVIEVTSDMDVPNEINGLVLVYEIGAGGTVSRPLPFELVSDRSLLDPQKRTGTLPATFGFEGPVGFEGETARISLTGTNRGRPVITRDVHFEFSTRKISIRLDRDCALARCSAGLTCVPRRGCIRPDLKPSGDPIDKPAGAGCNCESLFPLCVGAWWSYQECPAKGGECNPRPKVWAIGDVARIGERSEEIQTDQNFGKHDLRGFVQVRASIDTITRRWLTWTDQGLLWQKDENYDQGWNRRSTRYYQPAKLRLDPRKTSPNEPWTLEYEEINVTPLGAMATVPHTDTWEVVKAADVPSERLRMRLRTFLRYGETVCHHRIDKGGPLPDDRVFCFTRGLGKVIEYGGGGDDVDEDLTHWDVPGCSTNRP